MGEETAAAPRRPLTICAIGYATSTHVAARTRCFAELGHRVTLITESRESRGIPGVTQLVPGVDQTGRWQRALRRVVTRLAGPAGDHLQRAVSLMHLLRKIAPDVVHVHFAYSYYGWLAGILGFRPLVVTVMGGDVLLEEQGTPTEAGTWLTGQLLRRADLITSKSHFLTQKLDERWGVGEKAERVIWGIALDRFARCEPRALAERWGVAGKVVLLSPRILQPLYQVHRIVEAMPAVLARHPEAVLLVTEYAADAAYRARIVARVAELGISDAVIFCGRVEQDEMPGYYSLARLSVSVPSSDGLPQTLLESMACGTPSILSDLPGYREIVQHGKSAWLVEQTPEAIAAGINRLLDDEGLRTGLAAAALEVVSAQGSLAVEARRVEAAYYRLRDTIPPSRGTLRQVIQALGAWARFRVALRRSRAVRATEVS